MSASKQPHHTSSTSGGLDHRKCLFKSLRLARSSRKVTNWLFSDSLIPYHRNAPQLSASAFAASASLQSSYFLFHFPSHYDPFGVEDGEPNSIPSQSTPHPNPNASDPSPSSDSQFFASSTDSLLTPVLRVNPSIILGYCIFSGTAFNPVPNSFQPVLLRGKTHFTGRFAYDTDNNHFLFVYNAVSPHHTLLIDFSFTGLSRECSTYTIPYQEYSYENLPTQVLSLLAIVEAKIQPQFSPSHSSTHSPSSNLPSDSSSLMQIPGNLFHALNHTPESHPIPYGLPLVDFSNSPSGLAQNSLTLDLQNFIHGIIGRCKGPAILRDVLDPQNEHKLVSRVHGAVASVIAQPAAAQHQNMLVHGWQVYSNFAVGLRSDLMLTARPRSGTGEASEMRETAQALSGTSEGMMRHSIHDSISDSDEEVIRNSKLTPNASSSAGGSISNYVGMNANVSAGAVTGMNSGVGAIAGASERLRVDADAGVDASVGEGGFASVWKEGEGPGGTTQREGAESGDLVTLAPRVTGTEMNGTGRMGSGVAANSAEDLSLNEGRVREVRTCHTCKGLIGRRGISLVDEETMRLEKLEAKKRKNRLSAARSNLRRKERETQQHSELQLQQEMLVELTRREEELRAENLRLRHSAVEQGLLVIAEDAAEVVSEAERDGEGAEAETGGSGNRRNARGGGGSNKLRAVK